MAAISNIAQFTRTGTVTTLASPVAQINGNITQSRQPSSITGLQLGLAISRIPSNITAFQRSLATERSASNLTALQRGIPQQRLASNIASLDRQSPIVTIPGRVRSKQISYDVPPIFPIFTVSTLPEPLAKSGKIINVSDAPGGWTVAYSDGIVWRSFIDRSIIQ